MIDLIHISEKELEELWIDDPDILDELVRDSELKSHELADVFVKHPILQQSILKYSDPVKLYDDVYESQVNNANPIDYEHDMEEYKKVKDEYMNAFHEIKQYVTRDLYYAETPIADKIRNAPVEVEDWNDPYGSIKRANSEKYEEGIELGLNKHDIDNLPNYSTEKIASILGTNPESLTFVKKVLEKNNKTLDIQKLVLCLYDETNRASKNPNNEDVDFEGKKNALKELGYNYEELKEIQEKYGLFGIDKNGNIVDPGGKIINSIDENIGSKTSLQQEKTKSEEPSYEINEFGEIIRPNNTKTLLQQKEEELSSLEEEEKKISEVEALIKKEMDKKGKDIGE